MDDLPVCKVLCCMIYVWYSYYKMYTVYLEFVFCLFLTSFKCRTNMSYDFIDLSLSLRVKCNQRFFSTNLWRYWVWSRVFPAAFPTCSTSCARFGAKNLVESTKEFQKGYCALHRVRGKTSLCFCRKTQGVGSFVFFVGCVGNHAVDGSEIRLTTYIYI